MVKIKYANNPDILQLALKDLSKIHVVDKNLHETRNEMIGDYDGEFEMVVSLVIGDQIRQTHIGL